MTVTPHPFPVKSLRRKKRTCHLKRRNYYFAFGGQEAFWVMIDSSIIYRDYNCNLVASWGHCCRDGFEIERPDFDIWSKLPASTSLSSSYRLLSVGLCNLIYRCLLKLRYSICNVDFHICQSCFTISTVCFQAASYLNIITTLKLSTKVCLNH